jgi:hypothetical protein
MENSHLSLPEVLCRSWSDNEGEMEECDSNENILNGCLAMKHLQSGGGNGKGSNLIV